MKCWLALILDLQRYGVGAFEYQFQLSLGRNSNLEMNIVFVISVHITRVREYGHIFTPTALSLVSRSYGLMALYVPPLNFGMVEEDLYRSGEPSQINFPFLEKLQLRKIIYLAPDQPSEELYVICAHHVSVKPAVLVATTTCCMRIADDVFSFMVEQQQLCIGPRD